MKTCFWVSASIAALLSAGAAQAQTADTTTDPTEAAKPADTSGEIVVTAERRSTSLQRTGVAATVLTGDDLVKKSVDTVDQLQFATPSLTVNNAGQGNQFNIRGIGKGEGGSTIGVGVVTYRDGVATFPGYFQNEPYYDIGSVEVLRGPQGTFAGGNATGGAVFITEKNPDVNSVGGYALAQYGNYNDIKVQGALNVPLGDTLAVRFAGNVETRDTFFHVTGPYTGNPGNLRSYSGRMSLLWQPDSHWRLLLKGDYNNVELGGYPASFGTQTTDPLIVTSNAPLAGKDEWGRLVANLSYTTDGGTIFRSITGYQHGTSIETIDADATSALPYTFKDRGDETVWSQEFNIVSPDKGPFTWLLGGYYQSDMLKFPAGAFVTHTTFDISLAGSNPKTALAAFGQVGYKLSDKLSVTLGGRFTRTTSRNDATFTISILPVPLIQHDSSAYKRGTGKFAVNYQLDASNFLYAFVARGSKTGGINAINILGAAPKLFLPEEVTDYELGWKGTWAGGHLRTQLGGYYNSYKNYQVSVVDPDVPGFNSILNITDTTRLYGAEFSAQGSFGGFEFDLAASLSHSDIGRFFAFDPRLGHSGTCNPNNGPATATGCVDLTGRDTVYAPKFTLSMGAQYAIPLGEGTTLTPRVDYAHTDPTWGALFQNVALGDYLPARDQLNGQLTLATGPWSIAAYGTNLTDQHVVVAVSSNRRLAGPPRQYGLRVSRSF
jgi:iron complex outermembrane receptor protein